MVTKNYHHTGLNWLRLQLKELEDTKEADIYKSLKQKTDKTMSNKMKRNIDKQHYTEN